MDARTTTMVGYLEQALALERQQEQTLTGHETAAPSGDFRELVRHHRSATAEHAERLASRLEQLGADGRSLPGRALGLARGAVHRALTLLRRPVGVLRGADDADRVLRNTQHELVGEAAQIVLYDAIEALADRLQDEKTAALAREHRGQEERFVQQLREAVPGLVGELVDTRHGPRRTPAPTTRHGGQELPPVLPIPDYDRLGVMHVLPLLEGLSADELAAIDDHERAGRARGQILDRVTALRHRASDELLDRLT